MLCKCRVDAVFCKEFYQFPQVFLRVNHIAQAVAGTGSEDQPFGGGTGVINSLAHVGRDEIVGCATLCPFFSPTGRKASIEDVVVSAEYRGKGIGRKLVEAAIEKAKASAPITLQLTSRPTRVAANRLYQSMGFTPKETNFYFLKLQ